MTPLLPIRKLSVIVPVFNEEHFVADVLRELRAAHLPDGLTMEVIVVDDGSTDQTRNVLQHHEQDPGVKICYLESNAGKGAAVREGLNHVTGDVVIIQDADLEYSVDDYPRLLEPLLTGKAQVVYGSRFLGEIRGMKLPNRVFNLLIRWMVNVMFNAHITDEATAYKLLRTEVIRSLGLRSNRFEICPEITAKVLKRKIPIYEVPVSYHGRTQREGKKVGWRDAISAIRTLIACRFFE